MQLPRLSNVAFFENAEMQPNGGIYLSGDTAEVIFMFYNRHVRFFLAGALCVWGVGISSQVGTGKPSLSTPHPRSGPQE